jgi:hypothetical protein
MGYMRHHAIVVTSWDEDRIKRAWEEAGRLFGQFASEVGKPTDLRGPVVEASVNEYYTFLIGPDGSKEGWATSDRGDAARSEFIAWLHAQDYDDGSSPYDWALIQYGDEDGDQRVVLASDHHPYSERPR